MNIRPLQASDREQLLSIWNGSAEFDFQTPALLDEKIWADHDFDADLVFAAEAGGAVVGFATGVVRELAEKRTGYVKMLAVDKPWQGRGIGGDLLKVLEAALRGKGISAIRLLESAPNYLTPGIDLRYARALRFAVKHGFEQIGETVNLVVDLDDAMQPAASQPAADERTILRHASTGDRDGVLAFVGVHWPAWIPEVTTALENSPPSLYLGQRGGDVLGFAAYDANNIGTGWFGPMGVAPGARGTGLGCRLLRRCLADIREQGQSRAIIPWVGPVSFYAKCVNAHLWRTFLRFEKRVV